VDAQTLRGAKSAGALHTFLDFLEIREIRLLKLGLRKVKVIGVEFLLLRRYMSHRCVFGVWNAVGKVRAEQRCTL
jgi:hypothetical protein